jgi:hypothetical protein
MPDPLAGHGHVTAIPVGSRRELAHPHQRADYAVGISQHRRGPEPAVAFPDDSCADLESLARDGLGQPTPALDHGLDVEDWDASDHAVTVPSHDSQGNPDPVLIRSAYDDCP